MRAYSHLTDGGVTVFHGTYPAQMDKLIDVVKFLWRSLIFLIFGNKNWRDIGSW